MNCLRRDTRVVVHRNQSKPSTDTEHRNKPKDSSFYVLLGKFKLIKLNNSMHLIASSLAAPVTANVKSELVFIDYVVLVLNFTKLFLILLLWSENMKSFKCSFLGVCVQRGNVHYDPFRSKYVQTCLSLQKHQLVSYIGCINVAWGLSSPFKL